MAKVNREVPMDRVSRIRRRIEEGGELDLFSPNYVSHEPWHLAARRLKKSPAGKPTIERENVMLRPDSVFSDFRLRVEDAVEQGEEVVVRWRMRGKWSKPFLGLKPSNKVVDITGINIYRFIGDKVVESTGEFDLGSIAAQALAAGATAESCQAAMNMLSRINDPVINPAEPALPEGGFGGLK
ncbi:MAG: ester cyclase [Chloroflexia bacterium]